MRCVESDVCVHVVLPGRVGTKRVQGPPQRQEADQLYLHCITGWVVRVEPVSGPVGVVADCRLSGTTVQHRHLPMLQQTIS